MHVADKIFLVLYKEMYHRHIYSKLTPTLNQRIESWENYCELFNIFLGAPSHPAFGTNWLRAAWWHCARECVGLLSVLR